MTNKEAIAVFKGFKFLPREQKAVDLAIKAIAFKEEIIRMVNMGVYPEAIVEWVRESEAENE